MGNLLSHTCLGIDPWVFKLKVSLPISNPTYQKKKKKMYVMHVSSVVALLKLKLKMKIGKHII